MLEDMLVSRKCWQERGIECLFISMAFGSALIDSLGSVKSRLDTEHGISFTEFAYQLLQAFDFWYLYHHHSCRIQVRT